ncbi:MAG: hypothetical protein HUU20_08270 [Pirellulales bacterium]|nr:hypothetical protein [Pirellulales bacterium]
MQLSTTPAEYCCPGDGRPISRAVHLGRLARFYPACRRCEHRVDSGPISARRLRRIREAERRGLPCSPFCGEAVSGVLWNELTPDLARKAAAALGMWLREQGTVGDAPATLVGSDGRALATELVAAVSDGLRWAGCHLIEIGPATAPATAAALGRMDCDGGILVGNPAGEKATVGFRFWGQGGRPLSSPGSLEEIRRILESGPSRPTRRYGAARRLPIDAVYLEPMGELYHALRPLRLVLDCTSPAILSYVDTLMAATACEWSLCECRPGQLGSKVVGERAHLGIRLEEDGERCQVVDERGRDVSPERVAVLVARELGSTAACMRLDTADRENAYQLLRTCDAALAMDTAGRLWHRSGERLWAPDALMTLTLLLKQLSRSDAELSKRLDDGALG